MTLCPITKGHCCCQPQEGVACPDASPKDAIRLAYKAGLDVGQRRVRAPEKITWQNLDAIAADAKIEVDDGRDPFFWQRIKDVALLVLLNAILFIGLDDRPWAWFISLFE